MTLTESAFCRPMPELPPYLREGMSETDYRSYADRLKPHVDKALGALLSHVKPLQPLLSSRSCCRERPAYKGLLVTSCTGQSLAL